MPFSSERAPEFRAHEAVADEVDEAARDSFPASDPPAWNSLRAGPPVTNRQTAQPDRLRMQPPTAPNSTGQHPRP